MRSLTLINTLEYYDVPQILVAADATGTNYLCTLYKNDAERGYLYLGVQISEPRLMAFVGGQLDLRDVYVHPEVENALYVVTAKQETLTATTILQPPRPYHVLNAYQSHGLACIIFTQCLERKNCNFIIIRTTFTL